MRTNLLALLGLLTACQAPDLASSNSASADDRDAPGSGDDAGTDASGDEDLGDTGDPMDDTEDIGQEDTPDEVIVGDPGGRVLRGGVVGSEWVGGQVVAISSDGSLVEATIADNGAFAVSLTRGMTWTLHLRAEGQPVVTFRFQRNADSTETTTRLTIPSDDDTAPPPGAPPPSAGDSADSDDLDLGAVTPTESGATTESNPLEEVDADGDGVSDYEDPDDDGDGVQDELDSEPEVDAAALGLVVQKAYPALGSDDVDPDDEIMVEFSLELDPASVQDSSLRVIGPDGADLPGMVEMNAADLFFQPAALMQPGEQYTVLVEEGLVATTGEALVGDQSWTFRVEPETDETPLTLAIEEIDPLDGEVVDPEALLSVEFNQAMAASAAYLGTGGLQVIAADGSELDGLLTVDDDRLDFEPYGGLEAGASYRMVVGMQLYSETGLGLAHALQIGFSVAADEHADDPVDHDDDSGDKDDPIDDDDDGTIGDGTLGDGTIGDGTVGSGDDDGTVGDDGTIDDGTIDDGTIDDGTIDDGTIDDGTIGDGTIGDDDGSIGDDDDTTDDPHVDFTVLHIYPQDGQEVDANTEMMVEFSQELSASGVYQGVGGIQLIGPDGTEVDGQLWVEEQKLFFIPLTPLQPSASYRLVVGMQLLSVSGESLPEDIQVGFTVAAASSDDGTDHDGTVDDGTADDGTVDDDKAEDGSDHDSTVGDGTVGDGTVGDGTVGDGTVGDGTVGDGTTGDDSSHDDDAVAFDILATHPQDGEQVDMWSELVVAFTQELAASTVYQGMGGIQLIGADGTEVGVEMWVEASQIMVKPLDGLVPGSSYELIVGTQLYSASGENLATDVAIGFSVAPADSSHDDGSTGDGSAGDGTAEDGIWHDDGSKDDEDGTIDDGTTDGSVGDDASHDDGTSDSTAGDEADAMLAVVLTSPYDGQQVHADTPIIVEFTQEIATWSIYQDVGGLQLIGADGVQVEGEVWVEGTQLIFLPLETLTAGSSYELIVGMQLYSTSGLHMDTDVKVNFTVLSADSSTGDGTAADGSGHDDGTAADGTAHDDGTAADGTAHDDGTAADGTAADGTDADGSSNDDGTAADGTAADGSSHDDGTAADGTAHDDGTAADGTATDGSSHADSTEG